ncbi:MAG: Mur ligase family protein [Candidatus Paceibacterota bacterium]
MKEIKKIHFIGVGGIGMSALARFFLHEGKEVSGSDRELSKITEALANEGVEVLSPQQAENITKDIDLVVYTMAVNEKSEGYVELLKARELGIESVSYFEALGAVANEYYLIAVAGTHGKTTTTAMLTDILEQAELDPTAIIGSLRAKTGSNFRAGKSKYAVVEACEYKRDFLSLQPDVLVITNVEFEHVDYYKDLADVQSAFRELALKVPETGVVIADTSDAKVLPVLKEISAKVIDYKDKIDLSLKLHQPGVHNQTNAAAASAAATFVGVDKEVIKQALENFSGTWRRFEYKGTFMGEKGGRVPVYDDYGHHPTEILATINGTRELYNKHKTTVVFQSHTYSRTSELFDDFVEALSKADCVILLPIYAAREENTSDVSSEKLSQAIEKAGGQATAVSSPEEAIEEVLKNTPTNGVVVTMGAGDMTSEVAEGLVGN